MLNLSERTEALARKLATEQNMTVDDVVGIALENQAVAAGFSEFVALKTASGPESAGDQRRRILEDFARHISRMPDLDPRSSEEIMSDINDR